MATVHELAAAMSANMRLEGRLKKEEGKRKEAHLDEAGAKFFTDRASSIISAAEYEALVAQYGTNAHSILTTILTAKINGEELTPEQAYRQIMEQAGDEAGEIIDPVNRLSQQRVYDERDANRAWRAASGDPPIEFKRPKRPGRGGKQWLQFRVADHFDALEHLDLVDKATQKKK